MATRQKPRPIDIDSDIFPPQERRVRTIRDRLEVPPANIPQRGTQRVSGPWWCRLWRMIFR